MFLLLSMFLLKSSNKIESQELLLVVGGIDRCSLAFNRSDVDIHGVLLGDDVEADEGELVPVVAVVDLVDNLGHLDMVTRSVVDEQELFDRRTSPFSMNRTGDESNQFYLRNVSFGTCFLEIFIFQLSLNYSSEMTLS